MNDLKHIPIPIDERLTHLTENELNKFFSEYHYTDANVTQLLAKYNVNDIPISGMRRALKYREYAENSCPLHDVFSWQKAIGRNNWSIPFCPECKMELYSELPYNYFKKVQYFKYRKVEKTEHLKETVTELTLERYLTLPFPLKVFILAWYYGDKNHRSQLLNAHHLATMKICPTRIMKEEFIMLLQNEHLLIGNQYLMQKIKFENALFDQLENSNFLLNASASDFFNLWWEIAYGEVMEYLLYEMGKKNFLPQIDPKIADVIQYLIKNLSVQQSMFVVWAAMRDVCSIVAENNWDIDYTAQIIPEQIKKKADRVIDGNLNKFAFRRTSRCSQSLLSRYFFTEITQLGDDGFTVCPSTDLIPDVHPSV